MTDSRQLSPTSTLHDPDHRSSALEKVDLAEKGSAAPYEGQGTTESPFIVKFRDGEQANPQNWSKTKKWYVSAFFPAYSLALPPVPYRPPSRRSDGCSHASSNTDTAPFCRTITANSAISTLCIAFGSSVVSAAIPDLTVIFHKDLTVLTLSVSLYVLGFALGPLLYVPPPTCKWDRFGN